MTGDPKKSYECFDHGPFRLEYLRFGTGPYPILAFHGFGRKCEDFALFAQHLKDEYSLYSFNLFCHGKSLYPSDRTESNTIGKDEWAGLLARFLDSIGAEHAHLMGYSMGGRLALCLIEQNPERFRGAYLFAPDGLDGFSWYRWASRIPVVRKLFRKQIEQPELLFKTFRTLRSLGLISERSKAFLLHQTRTQAQRRAVYRIWNIHRDLTPDQQRLRRTLRTHPIPLRLFFGRFDPVIPPSKGKRFMRKMSGTNIRMLVFDKGHLLLDEKCIHYMKENVDFDDSLDLFS